MVLNLIDQANILKNLDDATLQREVQAPSGGAPAFLVLSEINRRKDMRQRYAGELAQQRQPTTVAQDLAAPTPPNGGLAAAQGQQPGAPGGTAPGTPGAPPVNVNIVPPSNGGGMAAAAQPAVGAPAAAPRGFAGGGLIDALGSMFGGNGTAPVAVAAPTSGGSYADLQSTYEQELADLKRQRQREASLALIAAGAGMLSSKHSNTLQAIGDGIGAGLTSYGDADKANMDSQTAALSGLSDLAAKQHADAMDQARLDADTPDIKTFKYRQGLTPDEQAAFDDTTNPTLSLKRDALVAQQDQVAAIGDAKVAGKQPPGLTGLYHLAPAVQAYIAKTYPDFNLAQAQQTWNATQRQMSSLNGPGQLRLKQAIDFTDESIDKLADLADEWNGGKFPLFNKASLETAKQGGLGPEAQSLATRLEAQKKEVVSELATVYKGGNSPTDEGLKLAESQFDEAWSKGTFDDAVKQAKQNIQYRKNSLDQIVSGVGPDNPYAPDTSGAPVTAASDPGVTRTAPTVDVPWSVVSP